MSSRDQGYARLSLPEQGAIAQRILGVEAPAGGGGGGGGLIRALPIVGPAVRAAEDPAQQRPLTRRLIEAVATGAAVQAQARAPFGAQVGEALVGGAPEPERVGRMIGEAVSSTAAGRAAAEVARDIAELTGIFKASSAIVGTVGRFMGSSGVTAARALGAPTADEAALLAARAAQQAGRQRVIERIGTDLTAGEFFGVADAVERQELRPLEQFVVNPLAVAALGVGIMGMGAAIRRFGPVRVNEATALLNADTGLQTAARDAQRVVDAVRRSGGLTREDAADLVFRAARGAESPTESQLLRETLIRDPRLMKNEFGLQLVRMQRPRLEPQLQVTSEGPLRLTYEDPRTRRETTQIVRDAKEARTLAQQAERGEIVILRAVGRAQEIAPFERPVPGRVEVPEGTEPISPLVGRAGAPPQMMGREPETFEPTPTMFPGGRPGQVEPPTAMPGGPLERPGGVPLQEPLPLAPGQAPQPGQLSLIDVIEQEQLRTTLGAGPEISASVVRPTQPMLSEVLGPFGEMTRGPMPQQGSAVKVSGTGSQGTVISTGDPRGTAVRLTDGQVVIAKTTDSGQVELPRFMLDAGEGPRVTPAVQQLRGAIKTEPQTVIGPRGSVIEARPDPQTGTVTLSDAAGNAAVVSRDAAERFVQEGRLSPTGFEVEPTEALIQRVEALMRKRQGAVTGAEWRASIREQSLLLGELLKRAGRRDKPGLMSFIDINRFIQDLRGGRGSLIPEQFAPEGRALGSDDLIGAQARALGGRAREMPNGQIVIEFRVGGRPVMTAYSTRAEADAGLRTLMASQFEQARLAEAIETVVERRVIPEPARSVDPSEIVPGIRIADSLDMVDSPHRYFTGFNFAGIDDAIVPVITRLNRLGPAGQELATRFQTMREIADRLRGQAMVELERALEGLTREEIQVGLRNAVETGAPAREQVMGAWRRLTALGEQQLRAGEAIGLEAAPRLERHFPHVFDVAQLRDRRATEELVQGLVSKGLARNAEEALTVLERQGLGTSRDMVVRRLIARAEGRGRTMTRAEAEGVVDRFVSRNANRISGHLERERLGVEGYITDARRAYAVYFSRNARRLAEAQVFGPRDERVLGLIDTIGREHGRGASDFARKVFDLMIGRERVTLSRAARELYNWQTAKLSLSVLANSTQALNIAMRTNLLSLGRAVMGAAQNPRAAARHAREVGAVTFDILGDLQSRGFDDLALDALPRGFFQRAKRTIEDFSTAAFNLVEVYSNRSLGVRAGEEYFMQQVGRLRANPADQLARRRLQELRFRPDAVVRATPDDLTEMMYLAGQRISNETQFRADVLSMPLWAQSGLGRFAYQFKSFAINQARFIVNEIFGQHGDASRRLRAIGMLMTVYPAAGIGITEARARLMGETITSEFIDRQLERADVQGWLLAGAAGVATAGAFGIVADMIATASTGNKFALSAFFIPPSASTALNVLDIGASVVRGAINADPVEFERAARTAARELGGFGATATQQILGEPARGGGGSSGGFGGAGFGGGGGFGGRGFGR